ncbi:MAG TPA: hypothetical protein VH189_05190 [Rhizomicrobium sp.]|nr:hypothetical protein [Rhizomicrobium sp.]
MRDDEEEDRKQRQNLVVLALAVARVVGGVWLLITFKKYRDRQDCFLAGHHNCAPIDTSGQTSDLSIP